MTPGCAHATVKLRVEGDRAWWACEGCAAPFSPVVAQVDPPAEPEYVSVKQLAARIPYTEASIRNMMTNGTFREGTHYFRPEGRPMFWWPAVRAWAQGTTVPERKSA